MSATMTESAPTHAEGQMPLSTGDGQPMSGDAGPVIDYNEAIEKAGAKLKKAKEKRKKADEDYKAAKEGLKEVMQAEEIETYDLEDTPGFRCYCKRSERINVNVEPVDEVKRDETA